MEKGFSSRRTARPKHLNARILAYCTAAGGILAAAMPAHADIVYSVIKSIAMGIGFSNQESLDFDNAGGFECTINFASTNYTSATHVFNINCATFASVVKHDANNVHNFQKDVLISKALN